jgi:hypothetical protein
MKPYHANFIKKMHPRKRRKNKGQWPKSKQTNNPKEMANKKVIDAPPSSLLDPKRVQLC